MDVNLQNILFLLRFVPSTLITLANLSAAEMSLGVPLSTLLATIR
jgi:hypothetical protein